VTAVNMRNLRAAKLFFAALPVACLLLASCQPRHEQPITRITIAIDPHSGIDDWLFEQIVHFNEVGEVDLSGHRIQASIALKEDFIDLLNAERFPAQIVVLANGIDDAIAKNLIFERRSAVPVAKVRLAIEGAPNASIPHSAKEILALLQKNKIKLRYDDPTQHATGFAALVLLAYVDGAFEDDELTRTRKQRLMHLLQNIEHNGAAASQSDSKLTEQVSIVSGDKCYSKTSGSDANCFYPLDVTAELDYRAYLVRGLAEDQVEAAKRFLAFLSCHPVRMANPAHDSPIIVNTGSVPGKDSVLHSWRYQRSEM
jgi:hypothetical protein